MNLKGTNKAITLVPVSASHNCSVLPRNAFNANWIWDLKFSRRRIFKLPLPVLRHRVVWYVGTNAFLHVLPTIFLIGVVGGGVQLGLLGTAATSRLWWNNWQGKPKYSEKTCPSAALSTTNPTRCPDANPGRRGGMPATNRLSYATAFYPPYWGNMYLRNVSTYEPDCTVSLSRMYLNKFVVLPHVEVQSKMEV
jgi:hypothetical protein